MAVIGVLLIGGEARAQGPDLVQITFNRAFGKAAPERPPGQPLAASQTEAAIAAGRAAAELPSDPGRRDAFVGKLDDALSGSRDERGAIELLVAIVRGALGPLSEDREYLHARLAEVNSAAEALVEQSTEMTEASQRLASPLMSRGPGNVPSTNVPVTIVTLDARLFANDDSEVRRTLSCDPCFTRRLARLKQHELEREMANATALQTRVLARRQELLSRGADFNRRASAAVALLAEALRQLDARKGGAIREAL